MTTLFCNEMTENTLPSSSEVLGCNPLKGFKTFAIHPQYALEDPKLQEKIERELIKQLKQLGKVTVIEVPNPTGYGKAEALMTFYYQNVKFQKTQAAAELTLSLSSPTKIIRTGQECSTYIWSSHAFIDGELVNDNSEKVIASTNEVVKKFIRDFQSVNENSAAEIYLYSLSQKPARSN